MNHGSFYLDEAKKLLGSGRVVGSRKDQYIAHCPKCKGDKFYFALRTGKAECKSGKCKIRFSKIETLRRYIKTNRIMPRGNGTVTYTRQYNIWAGETESAIAAGDHAFARSYLKKRNVGTRTAHISNIWVMPTKGILIFPLHNLREPEKPTPYYRHTRTGTVMRWSGEAGFEKSHHIYGGEFILDKRAAIIVAEGIFDILSSGLLGLGISALGAVTSPFLMGWLATHCEEVWLMPDGDAGGVSFAKDMKNKCAAYGLKFKNLNKNDWLYRDSECSDPGDLGAEKSNKLKIIKRKVLETNGFCDNWRLTLTPQTVSGHSAKK